MLEITFNFDYSRVNPLYFQLYLYFKQEILAGKIDPGVRLPSKRKLSQHLGISQNTIESAYGQLSAEGYIESIPRKGIFVKELDQDLLTKHTSPSRIVQERMMEAEEYRIDFSQGKIALEHFPYSIWRKLTLQSLYEDENSLFLNGDPQGELSLRKEIVNYLYQSRGVRCSPSQILIGAGTQYLLTLLTSIIGRGSIFSMEDPGYHRTREVFKNQGVSLKPIPLDQEGININALIKSKANITYVTPSHQFPNGMVMSIARRMELLKWADEEGKYIIEDDYDGEFRYKGKPIPSLQGLDHNGKVIYLGTFSKSLIASIRINYLVLPISLLDQYNQHFTVYKQTVSRLHQHTLWLFMKNGYWERHLNKMRTVYRKKQHTLTSSIEKYMGRRVTIHGDDSGLHILLTVKNGMSEKSLIERAKEYKIKVYPTSIYHVLDKSNRDPQILLGFGGLTGEEMEEGICMLKEAWEL
ncbi:PLP-dependent aminotransferase family protein [Bacillus sp. MRMR6]|uniref:MocR-like pyridoxine biosynthesis transcription factor PdxR n=1 Tax=Bacillus sp. MRMR6 TaxID=1928617 RepID=UPI000950C7E7|nr:PLP-dependent aminotransferase family protein [Bacillus sp. MRMR6]OLS33727.1 GntR family transcriptional regulator [Bacillus sp. MRMR6]